MEQQNLLNCDVIMLPTDEASNLLLTNDKLRITPFKGNCHQTMFLYFVSDTKIKEGDWSKHSSGDIGQVTIIFKDGTYEMRLLNGEFAGGLSIVNGRKIEATTDTLFKSEFEMESNEKYYIPQISQSFVKDFVQAEGKIQNVKLKTIYKWDEDTTKDYIKGKGQPIVEWYEVETDENNNVIII